MLLYYTEILNRIRSVSVFVEDSEGVSLPNLSSCSIQDKTLQLHFTNDEVLAILLPENTPDLSDADLQACITLRTGSLSIRLPLEEIHHNRASNFLMDLSTSYKWSAKYLTSLKNFSFNCLGCNEVLIDSSSVSKVNEMPSELWVEMMDFWHCHKPNDENGSDTGFKERYSSIRPQSKSLITASYYLGLNSGDFEKINVKDDKVCCTSCQNLLGEKSGSQLDKLYNWALSLKHDNTVELFKAYYFTYTCLLDNVNSNATRVIELTDGALKVLIWVFNVGIDYNVFGNSGKGAIKLYYTTDVESIEQERKERGEIEVVEVPTIVLQSTIKELQRVNALLPKSLRTMGKHWQLGHLTLD